MEILLKGGALVSGDAPSQCETGDVLIQDEKIVEISRGINADHLPESVEVWDVSGKIVSPGFIDPHVHLREPGFEYKETIATGTASAARGGFTSVACMPNTEPTVHNAGIIKQIQSIASYEGKVKVYPIAALTHKIAGEELTELGELVHSGAIAFSDDGNPIMNSGLLRSAMDYCRMFSVPIISHCEDKQLSANWDIHEGFQSTIMGLRGMPSEAETTMVARDIQIAELTDCPLHIAHVSTARSVEMIKEARQRGIRVTAEVTPHHLVLTEQAVSGYNTYAKVNPPLRTWGDCKALRQGLQEGVIDCIATDHAPHEQDDKNVEFANASFGLVGLETAFPIAKKALVDSGYMTTVELISKMSKKPADIFQLPGGKLEPGGPADVTIISPDERYTIKPENFASKGKNTPFADWEVTGKVVATMVDGQLAYSAN